MSAMASQITSHAIVYWTLDSGADQRKKSKLRVTGLCAGNSPVTGEFPAQRDSNAENLNDVMYKSRLWRFKTVLYFFVTSFSLVESVETTSI